MCSEIVMDPMNLIDELDEQQQRGRLNVTIPESSRAPRRVVARRVVAGLALAAVAGTAVWLTATAPLGCAPRRRHGGGRIDAGRPERLGGSTAGSPFGSGASAAIVLPALPPAARATAGEIGRLAALPPGTTRSRWPAGSRTRPMRPACRPGARRC